MNLTLDKMQRARSLRRLQSSSRNREESLRVMAYRAAQRDAVKANRLTLKYFEDQETHSWTRSRLRRWEQKLHLSPLSIDLLNDDDQRAILLSRQEERRKRSMSAESTHSRQAEAVAMSEGVESSFLVMGNLRRAKRELLSQSKQLRAMRDVERTNARILSVSTA